MATKSPGIYFNEIDNTFFTNPKASTGTILGIVGYASKGPINKPKLITSWNEFIDVFGKPVEGKYSGLAVKNYLSAKGAVLFERVAGSSAEEANYIIKNGKEATKGYVTFATNETEISVSKQGYIPNKTFCFTLENAESKKTIFIDTPTVGKSLNSYGMVSNIAESLEATKSFWRGAFKAVKPNNGLYGFELDDGTIEQTNPKYFIELANNDKGTDIVKKIRDALGKGENKIITIAAQKDPTEEIKKLKGNKNITVNEKVYSIDCNMSADAASSLTADILCERINSALKGDNIDVRVAYKETKFVFVHLGEKEEDFSIGGTENTDSLFAAAESVEGFPSAETAPDALVITSSTPSIPSEKNIEVNIEDYNFEENKLKLTGKEGKGSKILINSQDVIGFNLLDLFNTKEIYYADGQPEIKDVSVQVDKATGKIKFINEKQGSLNPPKITKAVSSEEVCEFNNNIGDLLVFMYKLGSSNTDIAVDDGVPGTNKVDSDSQDKVVITAKDKGEGTNNLKVVIWTMKNNINKSMIYNIDVMVNGIKKESFEDIDLSGGIENLNRFDHIINAEEGGSKYITIKVIRGSAISSEDPVQIKTGEYYIGKPNKEEDRSRGFSSRADSYDDYEYFKGDNGIPDDGTGYLLFLDALKTGTSEMANKDLYDFHILIAPDAYSSVEVQDALVALCEERGDAITIIDPPVGLNKENVINWHNGKYGSRANPIESTYAAVYWPWCKVIDNSLDSPKYAWVMPSIIMAPQYVRVDTANGPHIAPAGEINGVLPVMDIACYPNRLDRDDLYVNYNRINPIIKFNDGRVVVYGEKTTQRTNSVLTKIHTRRMLIQIKKTCRDALRKYIFMPNTGDSIGKISSEVESILEGFKSKGGINFYKVVCDETNNPVESRQQDIINVDVVIVPEGTIEQINVNLTLDKSQETVSAN